MSGDGWDGSLCDGGSVFGGLPSRQVPSQGGPSRGGPSKSASSAGASSAGASELSPSPGQPPSDAELIARMRSGDDTAYEELYRRHAESVRRYARTCCRDAHTADDLTAEVFARMLQAVRGGSGPEHAVRAYLLTTVRRVAATWMKSAKREQLVDDFAVFVAQAARVAETAHDTAALGSFGTGLDLGADVRAMHEAEQSMAVRAFRSLPERWQAVLWHTEVEDESPSEVATLFGLDANGTRVLASRAREGLKQAYLQAHVSAALSESEECARHADRLGAYARGGLRTRAERGLRKHLEQCARCRLAAGQIEEVAGGIPALVPVAVIGWFGAAGYAKVATLIAGGGAGAGAAGAATGTVGGAGAGAAAEGLGAPAKTGIAASVIAVAAAAVAYAMAGHGDPLEKPDARTPVSAPVVEPDIEPDIDQDIGPDLEPDNGPGAPSPSPKSKNSPKQASEPKHKSQQPKQASEPKPPVPAAALSPTQRQKPTPTPMRTPTPEPNPTPSPISPTTPAPKTTPASAPTATPAPTPEPARAPAPTAATPTPPPAPADQQSSAWECGVTVYGEASLTVDLRRACAAYEGLVGARRGESAIPPHLTLPLTGKETLGLVVEAR
ncbi:sigma-70 family RNA polymerase sigma factor [Streptomyces sporangiiformans]|uniref:Sigma-70 family RNA polymerase sigma factor n=1 Tax=Streptomyces sporangiiformans TaxID=2315329 RepID=A0A505DM45_9ACTN|nr:sigma-70 family RNA polymerase sigma factor [Streptomyces sporangiiformans]TPQ21119.1 sigma-70 family RNA polymerase sigma factor [Streptomyces sporangiiformans]